MRVQHVEEVLRLASLRAARRSKIACRYATSRRARAVAPAERGQRQVRDSRRRSRRCPARDRGRAAPARASSSSRNSLPIRHGARRVDGELGEEVEQVDAARARPSCAIMRSVSAAMPSAWPRIAWSRSERLRSACLRCSGVASKTTPGPKIGVMNGYAAAWSSCSSGARKNASCASSPESSTTRLAGEAELADLAALVAQRCISAIGSRRISSRWPSSGRPPERRGIGDAHALASVDAQLRRRFGPELDHVEVRCRPARSRSSRRPPPRPIRRHPAQVPLEAPRLPGLEQALHERRDPSRARSRSGRSGRGARSSERTPVPSSSRRSVRARPSRPPLLAV